MHGGGHSNGNGPLLAFVARPPATAGRDYRKTRDRSGSRAVSNPADDATGAIRY